MKKNHKHHSKKHKKALPHLKTTIKNMKHVFLAFTIYALIIIFWTAFFPQLSNLFFQDTDLGLYDKPFWKDFLVNANASIVDFLAITIVLYFLEASKNSKEKANELFDDLVNYSIHSSVEMNIRKIQIIRKLNEMNIFKIDIERINIDGLMIKNLTFKDSQISGLSLRNCNIENLNLINCTIQGMDITNAKIKKSTFEHCILKNLKAENANICGNSFRYSNLENAKFINANMKSVDLRNCDIKNADFSNASLRSVNLIESINLNKEVLKLANDTKYMVTHSFTELGN
ncbi:pentapeptide repeat-containing protein [Lelliottia sp.]|uniref:pentapeptide repeat-containing protein n=1 Tax=Lelliottia sp. TaxID=1898429 RepID=UPI00388EE0E0